MDAPDAVISVSEDGTVTIAYNGISREFVAEEYDVAGDCGPASIAAALRDTWHDVMLYARASGCEAARRTMLTQHTVDDAPAHSSAFLRQLAAAAVGGKRATDYLQRGETMPHLIGDTTALNGALLSKAREAPDIATKVRLVQEAMMMCSSTNEQPVIQMDEMLLQLIQQSTGVQVLMIDQTEMTAVGSRATPLTWTGSLSSMKGYAIEDVDDVLGVVVLILSRQTQHVGTGHYKLLRDASTGTTMLGIDEFAKLWCKKGTSFFGHATLEQLFAQSLSISAAPSEGMEQDTEAQQQSYRLHLLRRIEGALQQREAELREELKMFLPDGNVRPNGCLSWTACAFVLSHGCPEEASWCICCPGENHPACAWCMKEILKQHWRPGVIETGSKCSKNHQSGCVHQFHSKVFEWIDAFTLTTAEADAATLTLPAASLVRWDFQNMARHVMTQKHEAVLEQRRQAGKVR